MKFIFRYFYLFLICLSPTFSQGSDFPGSRCRLEFHYEDYMVSIFDDEDVTKDILETMLDITDILSTSTIIIGFLSERDLISTGAEQTSSIKDNYVVYLVYAYQFIHMGKPVTPPIVKRQKIGEYLPEKGSRDKAYIDVTNEARKKARELKEELIKQCQEQGHQ